MTELSFIPGTGLTLAAALAVAAGEVVALVGGGGKTTSMFRLGAELAAASQRAVALTTTHIMPPEAAECDTVILEPTLERLITAAQAALRSRRFITVSTRLIRDGRLGGIAPEWIAPLQQALANPAILIEADGSKSRPFKAPAAHEPVIPPTTTLVIPVVGLSILGAALTGERVHRPELVAALSGTPLGDPVTPETIAAVIAHPEGGRRNAPPGARVVPLLNQADDEALLPAARDVARLLIARGLRRVVLGAVRTSQPVRELALAGRSGARVTAVVLAAGLGRRMGRVKLALPLSGQPILRHVVDAALASEADEVLVVLGHHAAELRALLPANDRLRTVLNPDYASGQSSSVRAAVGALPATADAALFLLGDQPTLTPAILNTVIRAFAAHPTPVVQPEYRGAPGHPVLFAHALFSELLAVSGDEGGRDVLRRHLAERSAVALDCDTPGDVDTAADYESLRDRFRSN